MGSGSRLAVALSASLLSTASVPCGMAIYQLGIILLNLVPWLALHIIR